jgi:hypothetical protein
MSCWLTLALRQLHGVTHNRRNVRLRACRILVTYPHRSTKPGVFRNHQPDKPEAMVAPLPEPDPRIDPDAPVPDDPGELFPDAPEPLPPAPIEPTPDDPGGDPGGVPEPA